MAMIENRAGKPRRRGLHIGRGDFSCSASQNQRAFLPLRFFSKSSPLRRAPIWLFMPSKLDDDSAAKETRWRASRKLLHKPHSICDVLAISIFANAVQIAGTPTCAGDSVIPPVCRCAPGCPAQKRRRRASAAARAAPAAPERATPCCGGQCPRARRQCRAQNPARAP